MIKKYFWKKPNNMPHTIYQTEGIVLFKKDFGEAERVYRIYTEKFGMIVAVARGVRLLKSKLRYNLDLFSLGNFSLVKGRDFWRVTDVEELAGGRKISGNSENLLLFSKIIKFLSRMIKGEEENSFIWSEIKEFFNVLSVQKLTNRELNDLEILTSIRILDNLGYIEKRQYNSKKEMIEAINRAFQESHL